MFKNRQVAVQIRDVLEDVAVLIVRAERIAKDADCTQGERKKFLDRLHTEFYGPISHMLSEIFQEHNDLVLKGYGYPSDYFETSKKDKT